MEHIKKFDEFHNIEKNVVDVNEGCLALNHDETPSHIHTEPLCEMARLNVGNDSKSPFPSNIYDLRMCSNDHDPIHFHVTNNQEGWEVTCSIDGDVLSIKKQTKSLNIKNVEKLCKAWLDGTNKYGINNKQNAKSIWDSIHS